MIMHEVLTGVRPTWTSDGARLKLVEPATGASAVEEELFRLVSDCVNADPALRNRPLLGLPVLLDYVDAGDEWRGRAYDPRKGKSYRSTLVAAPGGILKVKGCIAFLCQTQDWHRAP